MRLLNFLKHPPKQPQLQDKAKVVGMYAHWRLRIFFGMYFGYISYYLTRKSFVFAMPMLIRDLGYTKSDLGLLGSILAMSYGLSKFASGVLADKSNPRYFMGFGLILTGICNLCFGVASTLILFAIFWGLNGWFQGWGWPPCARLLTHWYSQEERGKWWGFWNSSHGIGAGLMAIAGPLIAAFLGWRYVFVIPGSICVAMGVYVIYMLRDIPESLGLPPIELFRGVETPKAVENEEEEKLSFKQILFQYVFTNKYIWVLAIAYFFVYIIRVGMYDWGCLFLVESKGYSVIAGGLSVLLFESGGICGNIFAGWSSDYFFNGKRGPINVLCCIAVSLVLMALWFAPKGYPVYASFLMFLTGFFIFGPQMLIGMVAAEVSHKKAVGTATGFLGWIAYLGAASSGYPLAKVTERWGWHGCFYVLGIGGLLSAVLLAPLWSVKSRAEEVKEAG